MALRADNRTTFEPDRVIQPLYSGGAVSLSHDGRVLATCLGEDTLISDLQTGEHLARIEGVSENRNRPIHTFTNVFQDGDIITTLALAPDASTVVVCSRTLSMRIFSLVPADDFGGRLTARLERTLKPHTAPVVTCAIDSSSTLLATGGADGVVKVWDIRRGFTTHTLHGHSGVVSALHFFQVDASEPDVSSKNRKRKSRKDEDSDMLDVSSVATAGFRLASGGEDGKVRVWDLHKRKSIAVLDSHVSVVRALDYSPTNRSLLSAGRDKTVILWNAKTWEQTTTMPVLEAIEAAGFVGSGNHIYTGGETARLRIWSISGQEVTEEQEVGLETDAILQILHCDGLPFLLSVHADQTLLLHSVEPLDGSVEPASIEALPVIRRISGTHDEVIDLAYIGRDNSLMALATNSEDIRLVNMRRPSGQTSASELPFGADVALLKGHDDIIITIDTDWSGHWLATGAKDNTARLWRLDPETSSFDCYAMFTGHAESISAVALPNAAPPESSAAYRDPLNHPPAFLVTGSQDKTVKKWDIRLVKNAGDTLAKSSYTRKAHDKEMNAIDVSHYSTMFASASQDRTVKIWDVESGESIGVLRGHKRGVWTVAFSSPSIPSISGESGTSSGNKGLAVTGSGDKTVRIWSLNDYSCLRTFEGHTNSVLKVLWLPYDKSQQRKNNPRVASAAGDGLVKIWDAQDGECDATLDNHIDRVWALAVKPVEREAKGAPAIGENGAESEKAPVELTSGSADSTITFWRDTTAETAKLSVTRATVRIEQDQDLQNHIHAKNYREAIGLALQLNHPKRLLDLFTRVINSPTPDAGSLTGSTGVDEVLRTLSDEQLWKLLLRIRDWNTNARTSRVAQRVLNALFRSYTKERFVELRRKRPGMAASMEGLNIDTDDGKKAAGRSESVRDVLDGLKAYTEKHTARLDKMAEEKFVLVWTLQMMDDTAAVDTVKA